MNTGSPHDPIDSGPGRGREQDEAFDVRLRAVHAQAVAATPARVRLQLRPRRAGIAAGVRRGWSMAAAFAVGLVAVGLLWQRPTPEVRAPSDGAAPPAVAVTPDATPAATADALDLDDAYAALDESPDLYLWLASSDASAMLDTDTLGTTPDPARQ